MGRLLSANFHISFVCVKLRYFDAYLSEFVSNGLTNNMAAFAQVVA